MLTRVRPSVEASGLLTGPLWSVFQLCVLKFLCKMDTSSTSWGEVEATPSNIHHVLSV